MNRNGKARWRRIAAGWLALGVFFVLGAPALGAANQAPATSEVPAKTQATAVRPTLDRIAVIGASVSAGFGNHEELQVAKNPKLGAYLRFVLHEALGEGEIRDFGSSQFFTAPLTVGARQVERALKTDPTLVVGLDFLFWYANGYPRKNNPRRLEGLREGLRLLETIEAPLLIGDLPNVEHALQGSSPLRGGGPILRRAQLMSERERQEANRLLRAWAADRPNVQVFPLASLLAPMVARQPMELRGNRWQTHDLSQALQSDRLHPRVRGMIWVSLHLGDQIAHWTQIPDTRFRWNEQQVHQAFWASLEEERTKRREKELARARRKAERAQREAEPEPAGDL